MIKKLFLLIFFLFCISTCFADTTWGPTTLADTNDDCVEMDDTDIDLNGIDTDGNLVGKYTNKVMDAAWRWENVTIPAGSTIVSASFTIDGTYTAGTLVSPLIKGILEANPADWSLGTRPSQRTKTTASVAWGGNANWVTVPQVSSDLKDIVQEIIGQVGWASGNAIAFVWIDGGSANNVLRQFEDYDTGGTDPTLTITYTPPAAGRRIMLMQ
jgi:hypothetical protein